MRNKQEQWAVLKRLLSYLKPYSLLTFLALAFLLAMTVVKSIIPLVASHFIDQYLNNLNQLAVTVCWFTMVSTFFKLLFNMWGISSLRAFL